MSEPMDLLAKACSDGRPGTAEDAVLGVAPGWVAAPASVAEASELMRAAARLGLAVVPRGAGTRLSWGAPPARCDVLVDTRRLDRIVEHAAGDLVVKVEAGLPLDRLAAALAGQGQRLSLDPPHPGSTVGGTLATAASGPLRLLYGRPRDLIIGITVVRADGEIAKAGGKVVKNVAGYDLGRLFTGSYGTLGLIVEAAFRLQPRPAAQTYITCRAKDPQAAHTAVQALLHSPVVPAAIELDAGPEEITLTVLLEGRPEALPAREDAVAGILQAATSSGTPPPGWAEYPEGDTLVEVGGAPASLVEVLDGVRTAAARTGVRAHVRGSAGVGGYFLGATDGAEEVAAFVTALRATLEGWVVVRRAAPGVRVDLWGPVEALPVMRRVKDQFDPAHRLAPGRFVGGI